MLVQIAKGLCGETKACTDQNNDLMQTIQTLCGILQYYVKKQEAYVERLMGT